MHWAVQLNPSVQTIVSPYHVEVGNPSVWIQRRTGFPKYHSQSLLQNRYHEVLNQTSLLFSLFSLSEVMVPLVVSSFESGGREDVDSYHIFIKFPIGKSILFWFQASDSVETLKNVLE